MVPGLSARPLVVDVVQPPVDLLGQWLDASLAQKDIGILLVRLPFQENQHL